MDMQPEHEAWTMSIDKHHGHAVQKCSIDKQHGKWQRHEVWTSSMNIQFYIAKTCSKDKKCSIYMACSTDIQQGSAARTCSVEIQHGHAVHMYEYTLHGTYM